MSGPNSFGAEKQAEFSGHSVTYYDLNTVTQKFPEANRIPYSLKILLENLLRTEDGISVTEADIEALAKWDAAAIPSKEIAFTPARVLLQD